MFETRTVSFLLNVGNEIDLEAWRRRLDVYNRGERVFRDFGEIEFHDEWVDVNYDYNSYTIYPNGDIYFSFNPYYERGFEEIREKHLDGLIRENLSKYVESLTKFLRRNGFDLPSKFIVKRVTQTDWLVKTLTNVGWPFSDRHSRYEWICYIDLERFEMMYENKMNIEYKGTYLIVKFESNHPDLKETVELENTSIGGYIKAIVESSDRTPIDVLSDEGFSVIKHYLTHIGSALYDVEKAIEEIKACECKRNESFFKTRKKTYYTWQFAGIDPNDPL